MLMHSYFLYISKFYFFYCSVLEFSRKWSTACIDPLSTLSSSIAAATWSPAVTSPSTCFVLQHVGSRRRSLPERRWLYVSSKFHECKWSHLNVFLFSPMCVFILRWFYKLFLQNSFISSRWFFLKPLLKFIKCLLISSKAKNSALIFNFESLCWSCLHTLIIKHLLARTA